MMTAHVKRVYARMHRWQWWLRWAGRGCLLVATLCTGYALWTAAHLDVMGLSLGLIVLKCWLQEARWS